MDDASPPRRPRPVVSCLRCREKKLKCDRTTPCENCTKASIAETCTYNRGGIIPAASKVKRPRLSSTSESAPLNLLDDLQHRMAKVEELLGVARAHQSSATTRIEQSPATDRPLLGMVVAEGDRSQYHGQNDRVTLLNQARKERHYHSGHQSNRIQFLDVKDFLNRMAYDGPLMASAKKIKFLENKSKGNSLSLQQRQKDQCSPALLKLWESLPPKPYCDRLVSIYFKYFERTMRILHRPTFMRLYERLWHNESEIGSSSSIIAQLTSLMTRAYLLDDATNANEYEAHTPYLKETAISHVQAWLDELGRKQRTELSTLQVEILVLLSSSVGRPERLWTSSGALVRSAMVMGLHLDPANMKSISLYQMEMRKRLWATVLEIDLQASMMGGMPLIAPELGSYNPVPTNLNDEDFDESSTKLPASRPRNDLTDSLYQVYLATSLPQRFKALSLVQRSTPNANEAIEIGRTVEKCLIFKPSVLSLHRSQLMPGDRGDLLHRILLDLYLRRPLFCLYKPLLYNDQGNPEATKEVWLHCIDSSLAILAYQDFYNPPILKEAANRPSSEQDFYNFVCKTDTLWAALMICQRIKQICQHPEQQMHAHHEQALVATVQNTIRSLIARMGRKGSDLKDIIFLSLVLKWVQLPEPFPERTYELHLTATKTMAACVDQLLQYELTGNHYRHRRDEYTESLAGRIRTSAVPMSYTTTNNPITPGLTHNPLPPERRASPNISEEAEQWLSDFPRLAAEFTNFQAEWYNANDAFNDSLAQDWESFWQ
ncbi:hypothetical protein G6011_03774 [Alternaria panax]|uniref:Zn(2)-C6 fungal-type domain-containing protein n=1 Tax=Alternaria panax TaxID=48097 RepID=A0AAD4IFV6_9PLEO|nr:hypothetical protein G6011_03774 [Alternaria panax]